MKSSMPHFASSLVLLLGPLLSVAATACSGATVPLGEIDQGATAADAGGTPDATPIDDGGLTAPDGWEIPECATPTGDIHQYTSIADTEARVEGAWFLCSGGIGSPADTTGIELSGGKAHFLVTSAGALIRGAGADHERDVSFVDTTAMNGPGSYQMNLSTPSGFNAYFTRTSEDGRFLELNEGTSAKQGRYVRAKPKSTGPACGVSAAHAYTSIADVSARIAGRWRICSGGIGSPADTRGLELAAGKAWFLVDAGGSLARGNGWDYERTVKIIDTTSMNGPGSYQIDLETGAGGNSYFSRISETGDVLELDEGTSGKKVVYVRVP